MSFSDRIKNAFADHLKRIDSSASLDSLRVIWNIPTTQKLGRIIDDSIYVKEYSRLKTQIANAMQNGHADSIEYYQSEINYMQTEIDSITKSISSADTINNFGHLIFCVFFLKKNTQAKMDSTIIFIDSTSTIRYSEFMDSSLKRAVNSMN